MQHWAIFCILFRKLSIFAILTSHHCSFDRINYACTTRVWDTTSLFVAQLRGWSRVSPRPSCVVLTMSPRPGMPPRAEPRSHESNQGLLWRDGRLTKCIGNYSGLFIPFLQSFSFNAKYGIKRTGHLQTIMARLPSRRPDGSQTKVPFAAKEIKEFCLISLFSCFGHGVRCLWFHQILRKPVKTIKRLWRWEDE